MKTSQEREKEEIVSKPQYQHYRNMDAFCGLKVIQKHPKREVDGVHGAAGGRKHKKEVEFNSSKELAPDFFRSLVGSNWTGYP